MVGVVVEKNVLVMPDGYVWRKSSTTSAMDGEEGRRSVTALSATWLKHYCKKADLSAYKVKSEC